MKILILTSAHPTDDVRVMTKIAGGFADAGHHVHWFGPRRSFFSPELDQRVTWHLSPADAGWRSRIANLWNNSRAASEVTDADWIYVPDPDAALASLLLRRKTGARILFDIHEDFHNGLLRRGIKNRRLIPIASKIVKLVISATANSADMVIGVSPTLVQMYARKGVNQRSVLNTAPRSFSEPHDDRQARSGRLRVIHGKAARDNGTQAVIQALHHLETSACPEVVFITSGSPNAAPFDKEIFSQLQASSLNDKAILTPGLPHHEMPTLLKTCQVGLISYGRVLGEASLPNRLFEYMASGIAVLAPSYSPLIVDILNRTGCGITADFENPVDIADKLAYLQRNPQEVEEMGRRGRAAFQEYYSWEAQLEGLINQMTKDSE